MTTLKKFMTMLIELMFGLYSGVFRRGEHYDQKTKHLRGIRYVAFVIGLLLAIVAISICLYPSSL